MSFLQLDRWLESHYVEVPQRIIRACGSLSGKSILDVGCGEMLTDFGLLAGAKVTGLDVSPPSEGKLQKAYQRLKDAGFDPPRDYAQRLDYIVYDGTHFPFADCSFDVVVSVGAFEHIAEPLAVLLEMKRVCRPDGMLYIHAYPWWPCFYGSHLTDYITEPFFHLKRSRAWVRAELDAYLMEHPHDAGMVEHVYEEFRKLNGYSQSRFFADVQTANLQISACDLICYRQDLSALPRDISPLDAMVCGCEVELRHA